MQWDICLNAKIMKIIEKIIDIFYPLFSRWMNKQVYHYLACGTINTVSDWILYFITYNFIVQKRFLDLGFVMMSPHILSLFIVTPITFTVGFCFSKYITFSQSNLKTFSQIFRYASLLAFNFLLTYLGLKLLVEVVGFYPTPSKMIITVVTTIIGFIIQKYFSFRVKKESASSDENK